jgi:exo-1,4-beta-D-glucosaminidase
MIETNRRLARPGDGADTVKAARGKVASRPTRIYPFSHNAILLAFFLIHFVPARAAEPARTVLHAGWTLQSSCKASQSGKEISSAEFKPSGWYATTVPSTVVAAEVAAGKFKDPYFGNNLRDIPGTTYPIGENFAEMPMPKDSPYNCSWWYRTEFRIPQAYRNRTVWLHFDGVNYRANIWLNGHKLANAKQVAGAYRIYEFDATTSLTPDKVNVLAVETFAQTDTDLGINFVDWSPMPADKDMGLWRGVYLTASGPVALRSPQVVTHFSDDSLKRADLTVMAELHNVSDHVVQGVLEASFENRSVRQHVSLAAREIRSVRFSPEEFPQLRVNQPTLWWPAPLGPQNLYHLATRFLIADAVSDEQRIRFGVREITAELNGATSQPGDMYHLASGKIVQTDKRPLLFRVNRKKILIRGAGWTPDMFLRSSREQLETQFRYVRDMNLNAIRLEGKLESDEFFDLADEMGVLVMAGWCCCDHWEKWDKWAPSDLEIATESLRTQILRLRSHPSLMVWLNGSDFAPPANVEQAYIKVLKDTAWPNPYASSASAMPTTVTGSSGLKMTGPYDYIPPGYWLADRDKYGGAYGFNTETSPGPAIPLESSLKKMIPPDKLWPINDAWNFHAGAGKDFNNLKNYHTAMNAIYGGPDSLRDYVRKSQAMAYDGERAMFEAYTRNKYNSTGVIQWMLNNPWPSLVWHLYDYYMQPAGGYFGAKKACEPLHIQYSYDDRSVVVANNLYTDFSGLSATAAVYGFDLKQTFVQQVKLEAPADSVQRVLVLPPPATDSGVSFVKLTLQDGRGAVVSSNFYWLPAKSSAYDWDHTNDHAYYTSVSSYEDLNELNHLPRVRLQVSATTETNAQRDTVRVQLHNPSHDLAFQIRLGIHEDHHEDEILPVLWEDNYLSLMPDESRVVVARFNSPQKLKGHPQLEVSGWNIEDLEIPLAGSARLRKQTSIFAIRLSSTPVCNSSASLMRYLGCHQPKPLPGSVDIVCNSRKMSGLVLRRLSRFLGVACSRICLLV